MLKTENCFIPFKSSTESYSLPTRFTFPFYYQPHPLCVLAAKELQDYLLSQNTWQHNFGLGHNKDDASGKMFGVLLVENDQKEIGYLTGFSGKLCGEYTLGRFVPSVPETEQLNSYTTEECNKEPSEKTSEVLFSQQFDEEQVAINGLTAHLTKLESNPQLQILQHELTGLTQDFQVEVTKHQALMTVNRKSRKLLRADAELASANNALSQEVNDEILAPLFDRLAKESVNDKNQLKALKHLWQAKIEYVQKELNILENEITALKDERQRRSSFLQNQLFQQYQMVNKAACTQSLQDIFKPTPQQIPPSGSGDCAAPKLIQYAFRNNFKILAMAEFWWGMSPKSEIRQHKNYYPACSGKCEPILNWMLDGIEQDDNPLLINTAHAKTLEILYQDEVMAIVNKPNELLSVPGKNIQDSVQTRIKQLIPSASGPIIVHRLDMSTSGLMVIALTKRAHKQLQKQFIERSVKKRYVALLEEKLAGISDNVKYEAIQSESTERNNNDLEYKTTKGEITLPLIGDFYNRPRQLVCEESGKPAHTTWEFIEHIDNKTKLYLSPKTGRTHQLRVHCAHPLGLNIPILGDDLYGNKSTRLHLHAESISLRHPITKEEISFHCPAEF
ncbi:RluA family pseudouridine synthase [Pseudocolwellia sp. HL-MZ19]|uniref:RluA family pseudouridine synthase n=1 Tax=unclassified Pseudocolwellia TaxID=2848178 RepID=UPI003CF6E039